MGQSRQLRSPFPGRTRADCWPLLNETMPLIHEQINAEAMYQRHIQTVEHPYDRQTFQSLDIALLDAAKSRNKKAVFDLADRMGIDIAKSENVHPPLIAPLCLSDEWLSGVAEDFLPDIGVFGPELCFGRMADDAMAYKPLRLAMGSAMLFTPGLKNNLTAAGRFVLQRPRPGSELKSSIWAWLRTPTGLWRINDDKTVTSMIEFTHPPKGEVLNLPQSPFMIARIVETSKGNMASMIMPLPEIDFTAVKSLLSIIWVLAQRQSTKADWFDLLRYRPDSVYNLICQWALQNDRDEELIQCWDSCF